MSRITIITQKLDPNDYVFGFFYGHIIDLARASEHVHVVCLERGEDVILPANVSVHSLGKEEGIGRKGRLARLFWFLFHAHDYDTVLVHMEPIYILLCGWWWMLTRKKVVLWYNHVFSDWKLTVASLFTRMIIGVSCEGIPVQHRTIELISYERDLTHILVGK